MNIDRSNPEGKDYKIERVKAYNGNETWRPFRWITEDALYYWREMHPTGAEAWPEAIDMQHALCVKIITDERQKRREQMIEVMETEYL